MALNKEQVLRALTSLHRRVIVGEEKNKASDEILERVERRTEEIVGLLVEQAHDIATLRSRWIETDSRRGEEIHRHEVAILKNEAHDHKQDKRIAAIEARLEIPNGAAE